MPSSGWEKIMGLQSLGLALTLAWIISLGLGVWLLSYLNTWGEILGIASLVCAAVAMVLFVRVSRLIRNYACPACAQDCFDVSSLGIWDRGFWVIQKRCENCRIRIGAKIVQEGFEGLHD